MPSSGGSVSDAPIEKTVDGQHHQLAYITPDEAKTLVDQGGEPTMTNEGVMAYPPGMGDPNYAHAEGNQSGGNNNNWSGDHEEEAAQHPDYKEYGPTGWTGDAGVDAWENQQGRSFGNVSEYKGTIFTGGTYATDDKPASRTISYGNDATTEDMGRPDITYFEPTGTTMGDWKSKSEMNNIKYIQDSKLNKVKGKLKVAGFTDLPKDATFQETKDYITQLNRTGKILDSWENATDKHGKPLYDDKTIEKWKDEGYVPQSPSMESPGLFGMSMKAIGGAPLSYDQLMNEFNQMEEVGKSGGGNMNRTERMKNFMPNQYATQHGMTYNPHTKIFTPRTNERDAIERVNAPYRIGDTPPQESQAAKWFNNFGGSQGGFNLTKAYADAKVKQAGILGNPSQMKYLAVNQSPFYDFLKKNKLDKGIL